VHMQLILAVLGRFDLAPLVEYPEDGGVALHVDVDAFEVSDVQVLQVLSEVYHGASYYFLVAVDNLQDLLVVHLVHDVHSHVVAVLLARRRRRRGLRRGIHHLALLLHLSNVWVGTVLLGLHRLDVV